MQEEKEDLRGERQEEIEEALRRVRRFRENLMTPFRRRSGSMNCFSPETGSRSACPEERIPC